jgi:hypothetical protein
LALEQVVHRLPGRDGVLVGLLQPLAEPGADGQADARLAPEHVQEPRALQAQQFGVAQSADGRRERRPRQQRDLAEARALAERGDPRLAVGGAVRGAGVAGRGCDVDVERALGNQVQAIA